MKEESYEYIMNTLTTLMVEHAADQQKVGFQEYFTKFRRSDTYTMLYDKETGLWMNGPVYLQHEYEDEIRRKREKEYEPEDLTL